MESGEEMDYMEISVVPKWVIAPERIRVFMAQSKMVAAILSLDPEEVMG